MTDDFEKRMNALEDMSKTLAEIQYENITVINEYKRVMEALENAKKKAEKKFGGEIASESVVEKKVADQVERYITVSAITDTGAIISTASIVLVEDVS